MGGYQGRGSEYAGTYHDADDKGNGIHGPDQRSGSSAFRCLLFHSSVFIGCTVVKYKQIAGLFPLVCNNFVNTRFPERLFREKTVAEIYEE